MNTHSIRSFIAILFLCMTMLPITGHAQDKAPAVSTADATPHILSKAAKAFQAKDYNQAAQLYNSAIQIQQKATGLEQANAEHLSDVYYNLGNCYFRLKDYPHAVLSFERALRHNPANSDAAFNLELTQSKLQDRFDSPTEMFFISWMRQLISSRSATFWGRLALLCLGLSLLLALVYLFAARTAWRKTGFFTASFGLLITAISTLFAVMQHKAYATNDQTVVLKAVQAYNSPSGTARKVRLLNEGTTLRRIDTAGKGWTLIEMPDGQQAWISGNCTEDVRTDQ